MYSEVFLTVCPMCQSVTTILRDFLNKEVPCTKCSFYFVARENFIDVEDSPPREALVSQPTSAGERKVFCKLEMDGDPQNGEIQHDCTLNDQRNLRMVSDQVPEKPARTEALEKLLGQRQYVVGGETESIPLKVATKGALIEWELVMEDDGQHNDRLKEDDRVAKDKRVAEDDGQRNGRLVNDDRVMEYDGQHKDGLVEDGVTEDDGHQNNRGMEGDTIMEDDEQHNDRVMDDDFMEDDWEQSDQESTDSSEGIKKSAKLSKRERQGRTKVGKGKFGQSLVWGVALRKPLRERRTVRSYSPSREWTRKRVSRYGKGKQLVGRERILNRRQIKPKKQDMKNWRNDAITVEKERAGKGSDVPEHQIAKADSDGAAEEEFKAFLTQEIQRQILNGLGDTSKQAFEDIQVVKVEGIHRCNLTASSVTRDDASAEEQRYIAKVKLMASLIFPITLRANEDLSKERGEHIREAVLPCKDTEKEDRSANFMQDMKDKLSEPKGFMEPQLLPERNVMSEDTMELSMERPPEYVKPSLATQGYMEPPPVQERPMEPPPLALLDEFRWPEEREADVPESELYDFGCDRNEDNFCPEQVWASYDCKDGMPRDYVQIKRVVSKDPFTVHMVLLEPRCFLEWEKAGNALTCGDFSTDIRKVVLMKDVDVFSHQVHWGRGPDGIIEIYPTEGEVWALYKNFRERDPFKRIESGYEIVQVMSVGRADRMVRVVHLVRCKGSRTLFVRQEMEPIEICKHDFIRFSHQIPAFEALDREGCIELDPAAMPHEWIY